MNKKFKEIIQLHLETKASSDELFAKTFTKKNKNIDDCCDYIIQEVGKKRDKDNVVAIKDEDVFNLAIHYYDEDDIVIVKNVRAEVKSSYTPPPPPKPKIDPNSPTLF